MCEPATATLIVGALSAAGTAYTAQAQDAPAQQQAPVDDSAIKADQASAQASAQRRRQLKAASLLATSGAGDINNPVTGTPAAKPLLGS